MISALRKALQRGMVIPACPLALNASRKLDERRQRALLRYYATAGAGGVAVGVHTTQFAIREPRYNLFKPVLQLAAEELTKLEKNLLSPALSSKRGEGDQPLPLLRIGGICGSASQAMGEAELLRELGYHAGLLSLAALKGAEEDRLIEHCRAVSEVIPIIGFYLQPAVGGCVLPLGFWRRFTEIQNVVAIKIAPFNRYQTIDAVRAVAESGREDIALYTGNDDHIVLDLLTPYRFNVRGRPVECRIVGGLLGHWGVWTSKAVELLNACHEAIKRPKSVPSELLRRANEITDCNSAFFDAANSFAGCIAGLHEILRRQGMLEGTWCLNPTESLSPGQREEIDRVCAAYPHLSDDQFVAEHLEEWMS